MKRFSRKIQEAVAFAEKAHRKQKRKGSDIPYIVHPLCVAMIISKLGGDEDLICGALLHDVVEDCNVSFSEIRNHFGERVESLVAEVTESDASSWEERKAKAEEKIKGASEGSLLIKSADIIHNTSDLLHDIDKIGDSSFSKFNAPKEQKINHCLRLVSNIEKAWPENPLLPELKENSEKLRALL